MFHLSAKQAAHLFLTVVLTGVFLRIFVIDSFFVRGNSMSPLIQPGDYIFVNKLSYSFGKEPARNDIVVAKFREEESHVIKRVVGLPRERVEITPEAIHIKKDRDDEGKTIQEDSYLALAQFPLNGTTTIVLDPREYFVLGDNRFVSTDSRALGPIDEWEIAGKVSLAFRSTSFLFFQP